MIWPLTGYSIGWIPAWAAIAALVVEVVIRLVAIGVIPGGRRPSTAMAWLLGVFLVPVVALPLLDWFSAVGVPDEHTADTAAHWNRAMEVEAPARDSALETILAPRASGAVTGVVTAAAPGSVLADLRANGLEGMFDHVHTDVADKAGCLRSLRHLGGAAFYVGDTGYDITSARAAGYTTVSIDGGYQHPTVLAGARPDHHIDDLPAMLELNRSATVSGVSR